MNLTDKETGQVSRILTKIIMLEEFDPEHKVFGSDSHEYKWFEPASLWDVEEFEKKHKIELPREYKIFLCFISNGGPFIGYGLYKFEDIEVSGSLEKENILYPHMETEDFESLVKTIEVDLNKNPDEEIYNGLLLIGTEGCSYDFGIVVSGKYRGRIMLTDGNLENPFLFSYDEGFLSLYERWLDAFEENLDPNTVLVTIPKDKNTLIQEYEKSEDKVYQRDIIRTFASYDYLEDEYVAKLKELIRIEEDRTHVSSLLKIVKRYDESYSLKIYKDHLYSDDIEDLYQFLDFESNDYVFSDSDYKYIVSLLERLDDNPYFAKAAWLLRDSDYFVFETFRPYLKTSSKNNVIRIIAQTSDFRQHKKELHILLEEDDPDLVYNTLNVLINSTMTDEYLDLFEPLVEKFSDDDMIPSLIERYLHKIKVDLDYYEKS